MNSSTPPLNLLDSVHSIVGNTERLNDPLLQQHLMMSYHPSLNSTVLGDNKRISTGDDSMVRLTSRHSSEHEEDSTSTCAGIATAKSFPETVRD